MLNRLVMIPELPHIIGQRIDVSSEQIEDFCKRWQIIELSFFGSVLRDDFRPDSDIDILVEFLPDRHLSWDDHINIKAEISDLFGRQVDLVNKKYLKNPYRRHEILRTHEVIYAV